MYNVVTVINKVNWISVKDTMEIFGNVAEQHACSESNYLQSQLECAYLIRNVAHQRTALSKTRRTNA